MKKKVIRYSIAIGICSILSFLYAWAKGIFDSYDVVAERTGWELANDAQKAMHILCNATFSVGVVVLCIGLFIFAMNQGAFEMISYGVRRFISLFQKDPSKVKYKTFYDYHVAKEEEPDVPCLYLILTGVIFIILSILFLYIKSVN